MLFFPFFWIYNILKGGNIIKEEYYKDITIHEFCYLFIKKKKTKEVTAIGERKGIKGKEMEEEKFFLYRKRGYRSRNRCKAGNWPRKAVTIESWERTIFPPPPAITFRIRPPCIKYDVVVQFKQAWRGIRRRIGITITSQPFTVSRLLES